MKLLTILKIQTKIFINNLAKVNFILKIIYFLAFVFILFNYSQTGKFLIDYIKMHFNKTDAHFYEIANLLFFAIFLINLFSVIFLGSGYTLSKQLKYFPITFIEIILYEIIIGIFDLSNIIFVGIFFSIYFIFHNIFLMQSFLQFLIIFILFTIFVSNLSFFIKNIFSNYFLLYLNKKPVKIISVIILIGGIKLLQSLTFSGTNITKISSILNYIPSGRFLLFSFNEQPSSSFFLETLGYFIFFNFLFLIMNIFLTKRLFKTTYSSITNSQKSKNFLSHFVKDSKFKPLLKKEILYHYRSIKMIFNFLILVLGYLGLLKFVIFKSHSDNSDVLFTFQNLGILFNTILIITLTGNLFRFDGKSVKVLFILPIKPNTIITAKTRITYFFILLNFLLVTICLVYLKITLINYLVFISLLLFTIYIFHYLGILLSIYFPKKVDINSLNGLNISFITLIIFIPILLIVFFLVQYILRTTEFFTQIIVIIFIIILSSLLSKLHLSKYLGLLMYKRKFSIIENLK